MKSKKITIMVVEDEPLLLQAISKKMEIIGLSPVSCTTGRQAMDYLESGVIPEAIWLDYYLQDMNGLDFATWLKKHPKFARIPIVVVSNSASPEKVDSMLALGVNEYLLKAEYRLDDIINIVKKFSKTK